MSTLPPQSTALGFQALSVTYAQPEFILVEDAQESAEIELAPAAYSMSKRTLDLLGAAMGLLLLSPVILLVALLVKLDSRGPILFRQLRMGHGGQRFWFLKFRTMVIDAESRLADLEAHNESPGGVLFKMRDDPRITRMGRFLRKASLDELPQLFNILAGHMSLVGPRPLQMRDCLRLESSDSQAYARRLSVPQGLTGAWQVGGRSNEDCVKMLELDLDYVTDWSLALDLTIICKTVPAVLTGRGAC